VHANRTAKRNVCVYLKTSASCEQQTPRCSELLVERRASCVPPYKAKLIRWLARRYEGNRRGVRRTWCFVWTEWWKCQKGIKLHRFVIAQEHSSINYRIWEWIFYNTLRLAWREGLIVRVEIRKSATKFGLLCRPPTEEWLFEVVMPMECVLKAIPGKAHILNNSSDRPSSLPWKNFV
jgi:hypothetical protein